MTPPSAEHHLPSRRSAIKAGLALAGLTALGTAGRATSAFALGSPTGTPTQAGSDFDFNAPQLVARDLAVPWGLDFRPDGSALVTQRSAGLITRIRLGEDPVVMGALIGRETGEGGVLGLAVSPTYTDDGLIYVYVTNNTQSRVVRMRLGSRAETIFGGIAAANVHNGGRIAFGPDGHLYVATGDAGVPARAQDPASPNGKILRITADGDPAPDNPDPTSAVYSLGHRNVEGLAWDTDGRLWATELGEDAFDEVNLIAAGGNYGWPELEGISSAEDGFIDPQVTWSPEAASPAGCAVIGDTLYVAALRGERLYAIPITDDGLGDPVAVLIGFGRLRTVAAAPDGTLWLTTSNHDGRGEPVAGDDRIIRFTPRSWAEGQP